MNKLNIFTFGLLSLIALNSCDDSIETPELTIETDKLIINLNDSVTFSFLDQPDFITFYSGESGHEYQYRERTTLDGTPILEFETSRRYGTQENSLHVMISTDFTADYTEEGVSSATWTDITNEVILDEDDASWDPISSGIYDLTAYLDTPVFFAFKYTGTAGSTQKFWRITQFDLNLLPTDEVDSISITDWQNAGWSIVNVLGETITWNIYTDYLQSGADDTAPDNEDWIISSPFYLNEVSPDYGIAIKEYAERLDSYVYTFSNTGTYEVVFVATNANAEEQKTITKTITIEVIE